MPGHERLDFAGATRQEFADGYLYAFALLALSEEDGRLVVRFRAFDTHPGDYVIDIPLPRAIGDARWNAVDAETASVEEWTRWGIAIPIETAHTVGAATARAGRDGVRRLFPTAEERIRDAASDEDPDAR